MSLDERINELRIQRMRVNCSVLLEVNIIYRDVERRAGNNSFDMYPTEPYCSRIKAHLLEQLDADIERMQALQKGAK